MPGQPEGKSLMRLIRDTAIETGHEAPALDLLL
jgi:hypothetical protein